MPKVVTKVRTGGFGLDGEDLSSGSKRRETRAPERKLTWIAVELQAISIILQGAGVRLTSFPALRRLAAVEGENARRHQDMVKVLQLLCLLSKLLAASKGHEIGFPDQNVGNGLSSITQLLLDLLLDLSAILDVDKNKGLDIAMGKELGSSRTKCSIGTSDERSPSLV